MTDTEKKPIDDSKEELTEAELDQVAGGSLGAVGGPVGTRPAGPPERTIPTPTPS
jgi:hypothetical protein